MLPGIRPLVGSANADLGLGDKLSAQAQSETEEMRKKRMAQQQQSQLMGGAAASLFGVGGLGAGA